MCVWGGAAVVLLLCSGCGSQIGLQINAAAMKISADH